MRTTTLCPKIGWHGSTAKLCPNLDRFGALNDVVPRWLLPFGWFPHNRIKMQISTLAVALWLTCHYTTELSGIWALHHRYLSRLFWWSCKGAVVPWCHPTPYLAQFLAVMRVLSGSSPDSLHGRQKLTKCLYLLSRCRSHPFHLSRCWSLFGRCVVGRVATVAGRGVVVTICKGSIAVAARNVKAGDA